MIASIWSWIVQPLTYGFMQRGLIASILVGTVCAVIGAFIVLRGMAFFGDALSHTILPGVAVGYLVTGGAKGTLFWWALGTAIVSALGIGAISKKSQLREDTSIGIVFAGMFALGIALISTVRSYAVDLSHFLFGDVLGVSSQSLITILIFGTVVLIAIWAFYKQLVVVSFDPLLAATLRLPVKFLNNLLLIPDRHHGGGIHADRGCGFDGGHAGNPSGDRLFIDQTPSADDAAGGDRGGAFKCHRVICLILFEYLFGFCRRIDLHLLFRHHLGGTKFKGQTRQPVKAPIMIQ